MTREVESRVPSNRVFISGFIVNLLLVDPVGQLREVRLNER
jgi:hypothetical protein